MATITIRDTILDGNLGDGWSDQYAAANALAQFEESIWCDDLQKFVDRGHALEFEIDVQRATGCGPELRIDIDDLDDEENEYQLIESVEAALTDGNLVWQRFLESDAAMPHIAP